MCSAHLLHILHLLMLIPFGTLLNTRKRTVECKVGWREEEEKKEKYLRVTTTTTRIVVKCDECVCVLLCCAVQVPRYATYAGIWRHAFISFVIIESNESKAIDMIDRFQIITA